jgi:formylglycine-generating enzyme required for sulfatase activity
MSRLTAAREETDALFRLVRPEALYERPIPERHRMIFYLGHVEAFDWNLLGRYALDRPAFHPTFDRLFAFGIDPPPGELPSDQPADWPSVEEVARYSRRVREEIDGLLDAVPEELLQVALEHRMMHAETFAYILHQLEYGKKARPAFSEDPAPNRERVRTDNRAMIPIPAGTARLGRAPEEGFGWDNEFPALCVEVPEFAIAEHKVTNGEYLEFVRQGAAPPFFWISRGGQWFWRGMWEEVPLPLDWPVYVTHDEATAYARWCGMRLASEAEWHRAACGSRPSENLDFRGWDPIPVDEVDGGPSQMIGNGWEWTATPFAPFPGFRAFPFYPNYSEPFFDGQHYVLKGASPRTAACFLRPSFRNWFRPAYPYIYATFRLVAG